MLRLLIPALLVVQSAAPQADGLHLRERTLGVMGTELVLQALGEDEAHLDRAIAAAVAEIQRVEDLMTDWRPSPLTAPQ